MGGGEQENKILPRKQYSNRNRYNIYKDNYNKK